MDRSVNPCDDLQPGMFYRWQQQLFAQGHLAFQDQHRSSRREQEFEQNVATLEAKLARKDSIIAEISEEYVQLRKFRGGP